MSEDELLRVHGDGNCHICGKPKRQPGGFTCSYPHGMVPERAIDPNHPNGFWSWEYPREQKSKSD